MPHTSKSFVDILHDLWRGLCPAKLKQLLPHMASIAVDDSFWDPPQKFMNHDRLIVLGD